MNDIYTVRAFAVGGEYGPAVSVYWNDRLDQFCDLHYHVVLIQNDDRTVLVNTGLPPDFSAFEAFVKTWHPACRVYRDAEQALERVVAKAGVDPARVDIVALTPITIYTTGNLARFPTAKFAVSRTGWTDFWAPMPFVPRLPKDIAMPAEGRRYLADDGFDRMMLLKDEDEICPGITCFWTGGHHQSSIAIVVNTAKGRVVLADCCFTYDNLEKNIPIGWHENLHQIYAAYDRIRRTADIAVPLYDPAILQRFPGGLIA